MHSQNLNLKVKGNTDFETSIIDSIGYSNSFQNFNYLKKEIESLQLKLQEIGYIENELLETIKTDDSTFQAKISLNKKFYTIYIYHQKNEASFGYLKDVVQELTDTYFIVPISDVRFILQKINDHYINNGMPFSNVKLSRLKKRKENTLEASLIINNSQKREIDDIVIKNYDAFPKSYLKHFLKIKSGDQLSIEELNYKTQLLNSLPFANQIRDPEILFTKDSTKVFLYIEKTVSNTFDGFLGFGTNEASSKLKFNGYLDLSLTNNLNFGESFNLQYKSDENDQKTFNVLLETPYLFNSPIGTEIGINIFKKDSSFTTVNQSANLFYQVNDKQKVSLGISGIKSNSLSDSNQSLNVDDYNSTFYNIGYQFSKIAIGNPLSPVSFYFNFTGGLGNRTQNKIKKKQTSFSLNTFKEFKLNSKNSVFLKITSEGIDSEDYLTNELLRFGGINSIRGFEENSLTATFYGVLNTEYRYRLNPSIFIHTIIDAAYINNNISQLKQKLYGFGVGFNILTKAGLLKFNYASGKVESKKTAFSNSKVHISLNTKF